MAPLRSKKPRPRAPLLATRLAVVENPGTMSSLGACDLLRRNALGVEGHS